VCVLDGKTQKTSRGCNDSLGTHEPGRLGEFRDGSSVDGLQQSGSAEDDCPRQGSTGCDTLKRNPTAGKILKRLKFIQDEYVSYVRGHQERLETRLDESKQREAVFLQAVQELEKEIYDLISPEEQLKESK
jgi:hypothetical protein